jgi:acetylglutamate synthase
MDTALENGSARDDNPALVRRILKELNDQCLALKTNNIQAVLSDVSRDPDRKANHQVFRLDITAGSPWPKRTYMDILYCEPDRFIQCWTRDADPFKIEFVPDTQGNLVTRLPHGPVSTVKEAAEFILKPLLKHVGGQ